MVETVTIREFYEGWLEAYLEKFGGEEPETGRGTLNEATDKLIEAIETNTPIASLEAQDIDV